MAHHVRVALANDYEVIVDDLVAMLAPFSDRVDVVDRHFAPGWDDGWSDAVDVAVIDTFGGRRRAIGRLSEASTGARPPVLVYTRDAPVDFLQDAEECDVEAVVLKRVRDETLVEAIERVARGERLRPVGPLSPNVMSEREEEVLALLATGASNPEIASRLYLSVDTIKSHVSSVLRKLGVSNRTQAAMVATDLAPEGLLSER